MAYVYDGKIISYEDAIELKKVNKAIVKCKKGADRKLYRLVIKGIISEEEFNLVSTTYYRRRIAKRNKRQAIRSKIADAIAILFLCYIANVMVKMIFLANLREEEITRWIYCADFLVLFWAAIDRITSSRSKKRQISQIKEEKQYLQQENDLLRKKLGKALHQIKKQNGDQE